MVVELPHHTVHLGTVERLYRGNAAFVDQPVMVGQSRRARIGGAGAALRHLPHAQVGPVCEVAMTADKHSVKPIRQRRAAMAAAVGLVLGPFLMGR